MVLNNLFLPRRKSSQESSHWGESNFYGRTNLSAGNAPYSHIRSTSYSAACSDKKISGNELKGLENVQFLGLDGIANNECLYASEIN